VCSGGACVYPAAPDGTPCASGRLCSTGTCAPGCDIAGTLFAANAANPANACQSCQPATSTTAWTSLPNGTSCGSGRLCSTGTCASACEIGGTLFAANAPNPGNACQSCQPSVSTTAWTTAPNGTSCGQGHVCSGGTCAPGCDIGGALFAANAPNPANACQSCQPSVSTTAWTDAVDGTSCGPLAFCSGGSCQPGCEIGGVVYGVNAVNPENSCLSCQPTVSTTAWTNVALGTSCGSGLVCHLGVCEPDHVQQVAVALTATCAVKVSGTVYCWGYGSSGQLGNGTVNVVTQDTPAQVPGISDALQLAAGFGHFCALRANGQVLCWGENGVGQTGSGSTALVQPTPTPVVGIADAVAVGASASVTPGGGDSTCALHANGSVSCWGDGAFGQLGNGSLQNSNVPVTVQGLVGAGQVSPGGDSTCALVGGAIECWGGNSAGQLGNGTFTDSLTPVSVNGIHNAKQLDCGWHHCCAVLADDTVECWGGNDDGALGVATATATNSPTPIPNGVGAVRQVSGGLGNTCASETSGGASCWGNDQLGQLGNGITSLSCSPGAVLNLTNAVQVSARGSHSCAVLQSGGVACWGDNGGGMLGNGTTTPSLVPVNVVGLP